MNARTMTVLFVAVLAVSTALWIGRRSADPSSPQQIVEAPQPNLAGPIDPDPAPEPPDAIVAEEKIELPARSARAVAGPPPPPPPGSTPQLAPGMYRKYVSDDFHMYTTIMNIGSLPISRGSELSPKDMAMIKAVSRVNDLTEEDVRKVLDYSMVAAASGSSQQVKEQEGICAERERISSLDQIGAAMNAYSKKAEAHQEELGRGAQAFLGPETYSRISTALQAQPKQETSVYDATVLLHSQGREVAEVVALFCRAGK